MTHEDPGPARLSRRRLLGGAVTLVCAAPALELLGCAPAAAGSTKVDGWDIPPGTMLVPARHAQLAALFDALIPGSPGSPGAAEAHAAWYLDQLLGAFRTDPPLIFAGGPYSGRHGGVDGFARLLPLTRVEEIRWRIYLEGSRGLPEREFAGPVVGAAQRYEDGLAVLDAAARAQKGQTYAALPLDDRRALLRTAAPAFLALAYEHAVEGTYGDPVYGGNFEGKGWAAIEYEGDRQPVGYSARQMSNPEEG